MKQKFVHRPLYREMVREAWLITWHAKRLWPLAILAGILQTGGIYDMIFSSIHGITEQSRMLISGVGAGPFQAPFFSFSSLSSWLTNLGIVQAMLSAGLLVGIFLAASVIAQGALVVGLGGRVRGRPLSLRACLTIGAQYFWPVTLLNLITLGFIWFARFLVVLPLAWSLREVSFVSVTVYLLSSLLFLVTSVALTAIHLFSLQAMIFQQASLMEALDRSIAMLRKSWVIILEFAIVFLLVGVLIYLGAFTLFLIASLPIFLLGIASILLQYTTLFWLVSSLGIILFLAIILTAGAMTITFQYAGWNRLYRRVGEGDARAKFHRWLHWLTGHYSP